MCRFCLLGKECLDGLIRKHATVARSQQLSNHYQRAQTCRPSTRWNARPAAYKPLECTNSTRAFSTTRCLARKSVKFHREEKKAAADPKASREAAGGGDPYDFSTLEADIASTIEKLKKDLSKFRTGGRFNPEVLENLRVQPDKTNKQTVKLSDLAQVIPKGRNVQVLVGEKDHVKPIISSIVQSPNLSLTPQPDPTGQDPLLLVLNIPPPTAESRQAAVDEAAKAGEKASASIRDARGKQQKKLRALQLSKSARPDDLQKAGAMMEKVVEKGTAELKKVVENAKKVLKSG